MLNFTIISLDASSLNYVHILGLPLYTWITPELLDNIEPVGTRTCAFSHSILSDTTSDPPPLWRDDLRCGPSYPVNGQPGQCNPSWWSACCSPGGWCGYTWYHCQCPSCIDYRSSVNGKLFPALLPYLELSGSF